MNSVFIVRGIFYFVPMKLGTCSLWANRYQRILGIFDALNVAEVEYYDFDRMVSAIFQVRYALSLSVLTSRAISTCGFHEWQISFVKDFRVFLLDFTQFNTVSFTVHTWRKIMTWHETKVFDKFNWICHFEMNWIHFSLVAHLFVIHKSWKMNCIRCPDIN